MNIRIPYSWIQDYLKTNVNPDKVFELMTASGPTVEHVTKGNSDYLLDIEVTINRPDCLSVLGIAREMYAVLQQNGVSVQLVNDFLVNPPKKIFPKTKIPFMFKIDSTLCPRFTGIVLEDVKIRPSPDFIIERLKKSGMRSLNNIIDITNFIMLELGQPCHAFDKDKIKGSKFIIRGAKNGEKIITLDDKIRLLGEGDIIYEDGKKIFDLSGIMGGKVSEIDQNTKNVFFTVVNDYYAQIRKTAMRLGIQTEASARLSKVLNQEVVLPTMLRGIDLLEKYAQAKIKSELLDFYPQKQKVPQVKTTDTQLAKLNGILIPPAKTDKILKSLGFKIKRSGQNLTVKPPIWRINDITIPEDLAEEVARIYNYDHIPNQAPVFELPISHKKENFPFLIEEKIRHLLTGWGFQETLSFSMLSKQDLLNINLEPNKALKITNPLTEDWIYMQPTLIPNLLKNLAKNQYLKPNLSLFEIANVFNKKGLESRHLILGIIGHRFFDLKGIVEQLFSGVKLRQVEFTNGEDSFFEEPKAVILKVSGKNFAGMGLVKQSLTELFGLKERCLLAEINLDLLINHINEQAAFQSLEKYNPAIEDLCLNLPTRVTYQEVHQLIEKTEGVQKVNFVDHYQNRVTIRISYYLRNKQINSDQARQIRQKLLSCLESKLQVTLRQN